MGTIKRPSTQRDLYMPAPLPSEDDTRPPLGYPPWAPRFIDVLSRTGNVRASCLAVGISRATAVRYRYGDTVSVATPSPMGPNRQFVLDWDNAIQDALDLLRNEAMRRALKSSDRLLMFLLRAHDPEMYGAPRVQIDQSQNAYVLGSDEVKAIRARVEEKLLAERVVPPRPGSHPDIIDVTDFTETEP